MPCWNCGYVSGCGGACGGREDDEDAWSEWARGFSGAFAGLGGEAGAGVEGWEAVALLSTLVCWDLGTGVPPLLRARFGWTGGGTGKAWACGKGWLACRPGSHSGGSASVCMVTFAQFHVKLASFPTASGGSVDNGSAGGLLSKGRWSK